MTDEELRPDARRPSRIEWNRRTYQKMTGMLTANVTRRKGILWIRKCPDFRPPVRALQKYISTCPEELQILVYT